VSTLVSWIILGVIYLTTGATLWYLRRTWPKRLVVLRDTVEIELELCKQLRLIMQDLESRDPQLVEHMQLGYIELDKMEGSLRRSSVALKVLQKARMVDGR
jgi:hypothetical protein